MFSGSRDHETSHTHSHLFSLSFKDYLSNKITNKQKAGQRQTDGNGIPTFSYSTNHEMSRKQNRKLDIRQNDPTYYNAAPP